MGGDNGAKDADTGMWSGNAAVSKGLLPGRRTFGPIFLVSICPVFVIFVQHCLRNHDGSLFSGIAELVEAVASGKGSDFLRAIWPAYDDPQAWKFIGVWAGLALVLMRVLPGADFVGPISPTGHVPIYKTNGVKAFVLTLILYVAGAMGGLYNGGIIYDIMSEFLSASNAFSLLFCVFLYLKGVVAPSTKDSGTTGNICFDYYYGTELYPRVFGWDLKQFTNCRFGMMFWGVAPVAFAWKQYELYGYVADSMLVSVAIQIVYVAKFFWWETGYYKTIDIMHDRAGFYICWGCLVWLPSIYTLTAQYLVEHPVILGNGVAGGILALGLGAVYLNYAIDREREYFREKDGNVMIWGKKAEFIEAKYTTEDGKVRRSKLLVSGWWGFCRKFNYTLELTAALSWSLPALYGHFLAYFYFTFLVILLVDRAYRDNERCSAKYGQAWDEYCKRVPYMLIPGVL